MENETAPTPVRWMTTREVFDFLVENGIKISFMNFRKRFLRTKLIPMKDIGKPGAMRPTYRVKEAVANKLLKDILSGKTYYPTAK